MFMRGKGVRTMDTICFYNQIWRFKPFLLYFTIAKKYHDIYRIVSIVSPCVSDRLRAVSSQPYNLVNIPLDNYISFTTRATRSAHTLKINQHQTRTDTMKYSFFPRTIPEWSRLPASIAEAPDLVSFKQGLTTLHFLIAIVQLVSRPQRRLELCWLGS
jgi:hypothetical protein